MLNKERVLVPYREVKASYSLLVALLVKLKSWKCKTIWRIINAVSSISDANLNIYCFCYLSRVYVLRKLMQWFRSCVGCPHFLKITFINLFFLSSRLFCNMYYALLSCKKWASGPLRDHSVGETMVLYFKKRGAHFGWRMVNYTKIYKIWDLQFHYLNYHWS